MCVPVLTDGSSMASLCLTNKAVVIFFAAVIIILSCVTIGIFYFCGNHVTLSLILVDTVVRVCIL